MNQEKIESAAREKYFIAENTIDPFEVTKSEIAAFKAGVDFAAANPDVIDCVKIEDVMGFAEWCNDNWYNRYKREDGLFKWFKSGNFFGVFYTTTDLYQIYLQQKQQG